MPSPIRNLFQIAFLLAASPPLWAGDDAILLQSAQIKTLGIETLRIGESEAGRGGHLPGRVLVPNAQSRIVAAPVAGTVERLELAIGLPVRRGQAVAHLASPQALELQRDAIQSASQASLLQHSLKRDEQLFAEGLISESRLQATRAAASQAATMASERRQGMALAGASAGKLGGPLVLTSPIDGVVLEQGVQLGQRVDAAALIYRIARLSPLWVEVQAPVEVAAGLREGQAVTVLPAGVAGRLIAIGRAVDPTSQSVLLRAVIDKGAEALRPGQVVEVEITRAVGEGAGKAQRLPASALVRHDGRQLVFVQTAASEQERRFVARPVKLLGQGGESVMVEGLAAGETVVGKGVSGLKAMLSGVGKE